MTFDFQIIQKEKYHLIIPLVYELNDGKVSKDDLKVRFQEMSNQNYECTGIFHDDTLIGVAGLWFCTRHYVGNSAELDHVYIKPEYRGLGLGKRFMNWIRNYTQSKGCKALELNTYVQNYPSHKFYYNEGYEILGYHFLKKI